MWLKGGDLSSETRHGDLGHVQAMLSGWLKYMLAALQQFVRARQSCKSFAFLKWIR